MGVIESFSIEKDEKHRSTQGVTVAIRTKSMTFKENFLWKTVVKSDKMSFKLRIWPGDFIELRRFNSICPAGREGPLTGSIERVVLGVAIKDFSGFYG